MQCLHATAIQMAIGSIFIARKVLHREGFQRRPGNFRFNAQGILAHNDAKITHLTPILSPAITDNPVFLVRFFILTPSHDRYNVIDHHMQPVGIRHDSSFVRDNGFGINSGGHGSSGVNFRLDFIGHGAKAAGKVRIGSVFRHTRIRENIQRVAIAGMIARPTRVHGRALCIDVCTKAIGGFRRAGEIGLTSIVGNKAILLEKFVDARMRSSVTRTGHMAAIENVLNAEIDFVVRDVGVASATKEFVTVMRHGRRKVFGNFDAIR